MTQKVLSRILVVLFVFGLTLDADAQRKKKKKNKKGNRLFTKQDIANFHIIFHLVKERGYTLDGAKKKLKDNKEDTIQNVEIVKSLQKIKGFLIELKEEL